jgi:polar amino acid transport system permease protein
MADFFSTLQDNLPEVMSGLGKTVQATAYGSALALALSFALGLMATNRLLVVRGVSRLIVEVFRGTSLYVQLFWFFYVFPSLTGYQIDALFCGVLALGLNFGAYGSEVVRGAIGAVPLAQREAAIALNLTPLQRMRKVIMPQAWVQMIPSFANLAIQLLKATPLLWLIQVSELMTEMQNVRKLSGASVETYLVLLVAYFILASVLTLLMNALEAAAKRRLGQSQSARSLLRSRSTVTGDATTSATAGAAQ